MVDFLQMCGQHKTARRCKQCGMLFVPFSSAAKYCDRKSPNGGQRTCKEVAAEEVASKVARWTPRWHSIPRSATS